MSITIEEYLKNSNICGKQCPYYIRNRLICPNIKICSEENYKNFKKLPKEEQEKIFFIPRKGIIFYKIINKEE